MTSGIDLPSAAANHGRMNRTVVIIPGFMGSNLVDSITSTPLWSATRLFSTRLEHMRLTDDGGEDAEPGVRIEPRGDFRPIYRGLMRDLRRAGNRVLFFAFDWRRPATEAAERLDDFIKANAGDETVDLVTHSMGGVIAALWLAAAGEARLGRMVAIALPAGGVEMAVSVLLKGHSKLALFNVHADKALVRRLAAGIPSLYEMLPQLPEVFDPARWPSRLNLNHVMMSRAGLSRLQFEGTFPLLADLAGKGRLALVAGVGSKMAAWRRDIHGEISPEWESRGEGDGWLLSECARLPGLPVYGFRPRLIDALGLGALAPLPAIAGIHPILPMFKRVRSAAIEFLAAGETDRLKPL
jgi:pimeloyl-ACP methyl ester carboxylesterase